MMKTKVQPTHEDQKAKQLIDAIARKIALERAERIKQNLALVKSSAARASGQ